jgi:hypothetical protein
MLFHITAKHTAKHTAEGCASGDAKLKKALMNGHNNKDYLQVKYKVKLIHGGYDFAAHTMYYFAEAESAMNLGLFMMDFVGHSDGFRHHFTTVPIEPMSNILIAFKKAEKDQLDIENHLKRGQDWLQ